MIEGNCLQKAGCRPDRRRNRGAGAAGSNGAGLAERHVEALSGNVALMPGSSGRLCLNPLQQGRDPLVADPRVGGKGDTMPELVP